MSIVEKGELINIFSQLNESGLEYILIRNINDELPGQLTVGKDIDILINKKDERKLADFFHLHSYKTIDHPFRYDVFLYGVDRFEFKYLNLTNNILIDFNFQLAVRSLDAGQWIPLDQVIQDSGWQNKRFEERADGFGYWALGYDDEFICLVARSIFDKREFESGYINRINEVFPLIDQQEVEEKLRLVFFKFTSTLMDMIREKRYDTIIKDYLQFKEY